MENQLTFMIEESVLFQRDQEIGEILSIALEPDIVVEEEEEYVSITGSLQLRGAFRLNTGAESDKEQEDVNSGEQLSIRYVKEVRALTNETAEFRHEFPVEITIPSNRVSEIDDIYVVVNSFDYEIPNDQTIQLIAELGISGIEEEQPEQITELTVPTLEATSVRTEGTEDKLSFENSEESTFEIEVKQVVEETEESAVDNSMTKEIQESTVRETEPVEENIPQYELKSRDEEKVEPLEHRLVTNDSDSLEEDTSEDDPENRDEELDSVDDVTTDGEEENEEEKVEKENRDENTLNITEMLAREDGDRFSKLKMRIIQPGDSLDSIAEAYNVSLSHLVRTNQLEDHLEIEEGEILYIPLNNDAE